jgi:hypothetical protein
MITVGIESEPGGFERRSFECRKCGHAETGSVLGDPYRSDEPIGDLRVSE